LSTRLKFKQIISAAWRGKKDDDALNYSIFALSEGGDVYRYSVKNDGFEMIGTGGLARSGDRDRYGRQHDERKKRLQEEEHF
jgi:hypothetical protein